MYRLCLALMDLSGQPSREVAHSVGQLARAVHDQDEALEADGVTLALRTSALGRMWLDVRLEERAYSFALDDLLTPNRASPSTRAELRRIIRGAIERIDLIAASLPVHGAQKPETL